MFRSVDHQECLELQALLQQCEVECGCLADVKLRRKFMAGNCKKCAIESQTRVES